ncbi:MAG: LptA/OstA family protein [Kiritimatiellae bacterium]|nr:LptA/OstA family protein [Kiritimatiellia bacterium]
MKKTAIVAYVASAMLAGWAQAQGGGAVPAPGPASASGLEITAEKFEVDQKTGWTTASGNVMIRTGERELKADRVRLHQAKGDVQARGNVVIRQSGFGSWAGDYVEYNYKTGKGLTGTGLFDAGVFRVSAHEVTRRDDGRYDIRNAAVTTCTNAPGHHHWRMTGDVRYKDNDYIEVYNAVPWLFGVPFAYLPYWFRDIDTHYGFRLVPGYTSKWGAYLLGGYVYNVYDSPHGKGPKLDATTHVDYRTRRGVAVGQNVYWDLKEAGHGKLETYYAWDQDPPDDGDDMNWMSDMDDERYRVRLFHEADLSPRDQFILRGTVNSDSEVTHDFFDREDRGESVPMNFVSLEHREHTWAAGTVVSGPLNDFYSGVSRLPEGWLNVVPQPVFGTGLNYESQTRAGYLNRDAARYERALPEYMYYPGSWADYNLVRVDTAHRVTCPMKFGDVLSVVPRAGYRGTYYSETERDNDVFRHSAELGVEASVRGTSDWNNGYRHVVEPYLDYSYQPTHYDTKDGKVYGYDRFDRSIEWFDQFGMDGAWLPYDWHGVRPGVRNLLQTRDEKNRMRTVFEWDVYGGVQFDSEGPLNEEGLRMAGTKMVYSPTKKVDIKALGEWDTENDTFAYADLSAFYKLTEKFRFGGGYLGRDHRLYDYEVSPVEEWNRVKENLGYAGFTHDINETWSWSTYVRYDLRNNDLDEVGGYVQYSLDCLVFQLRTAYVNSYDRIDGTERDNDFRVAIMMWLKAQNKTPDDEWLTW